MTGTLAEVARFDEAVWTSPLLPRFSTRVRARLRIGEVGVLSIVSLVGYLWVAWWMRDDLHFFVNDALSRTTDAVFVTIGRDPHLGGIGFYWPPLPQLLQLPFVPLLAPFGRADMAGPIASAMCMALSITVLGRLGSRLGLSRAMRFGLCAAFAVNPVVIYYAANGMSEACSILFIAIAMLGFLAFIRTHSTLDLIVLSVGLSGTVMTRLEAPLFTAVVAVVAAFEWRRWRQSLWTATLIALPPAVCFGFWLLVQWVLLGSPLFFLHNPNAGNPLHAVWLPNTMAHPMLAFWWALHWTLVLGPMLLVLVLALLWVPLAPNVRGTIGILSAAAVFPAIQIYQVITHTGFGDPRYFMTSTVFATVAVAWLASTRPSVLSRGWNASLVVVLLIGAVTGARALTNGRLTHVEQECRFFEYGVATVLPFLGKSYPPQSADYCVPPSDQLGPWQRLDSTIDKLLRPKDRVLVDNDSNFYAVLFTHHPSQFIVRNDRDWQRIETTPVPTVTYIVTVGNVGSGGVNVLPGGKLDDGRAIVDANRSDWKLVAAFPGGADVSSTSATPELFKYVGPVAPAAA